MTTHDGATILGIGEGRSKRDPNNPVNAELQLATTFETGDDRFKWMNNEVFSECNNNLYHQETSIISCSNTKQ